jgi:hypothetical protein
MICKEWVFHIFADVCSRAWTKNSEHMAIQATKNVTTTRKTLEIHLSQSIVNHQKEEYTSG